VLEIRGVGRHRRFADAPAAAGPVRLPPGLDVEGPVGLPEPVALRVAGLLNGSPSLTASTVAHTALATVAGTGLAGMAGVGTGRLLGAATRTGLRFGGAATAALHAGGVRGLLQTAGATAAYHAQQVTAGFRGAYATGRIYGANFAAVPLAPGASGSHGPGPRISARLLATRVVPPQAHPSGGLQARIHQP
jgi:hypothetical protein